MKYWDLNQVQQAYLCTCIIAASFAARPNSPAPNLKCRCTVAKGGGAEVIRFTNSGLEPVREVLEKSLCKINLHVNNKLLFGKLDQLQSGW
jgi:hypothetical protein